MNLFDLFSENDFYPEVGEGYVRVSEHPELPLRVLCYTEKAVYAQRWGAATRACRGLIIDENNDIVAHCMPKFFNAEEHVNGKAYAQPLPDEPFQVFSKADGSLGTVFWYAGKWRVATKGGFQSEQAQWAQKWLDNQRTHDLPTGNTYVTEIIYPENRIVVDNGDQQTLTLLAVIGNDGREKDLRFYGPAWELVGGTVIREYPATKLSKLMFYAGRNKGLDGREIAGDQAEGYVLKYASGLRVKVKYADYIRLHGIITGLSERNVWDLMRTGRSLSDLYDVLPDEYHEWVVDVAQRLTHQFIDRALHMTEVFHGIANNHDRQTIATRIAAEAPENQGVLFAMYDVMAQHIWPTIRPAANGPWKDTQ